MAECLIPPWVRPESPETIRIIDDATVAFQPAFGRGTTQRGIFADPRWGLRRRYRGLRSDERAAILNALNESRGQFNVIRVTPHTPIRGSFATSELLTNNTFVNGTTGWTGNAGGTLSVADRVMRLTASQAGNASFFQNVANAQYVPYVLRAFISDGAQTTGLSIGPSLDLGVGSPVTSLSGSRGMMTVSGVPLTGSTLQIFPALFGAAFGFTAGAYVSIPYTSMSRCALIDNGANLGIRSDELDNAAWSKIRCTVSANTTDPLGTSTADSIIEDSSNNTHLVQPTANITVSSAIAEYAFAVALKAGGRTWARIAIFETTGSTAAYTFVNLSTGALGTSAVGANWSNVRAFSSALGNGWFYVCIVARKTNAATSIVHDIRLATADTVDSYLGAGAANILAWRATLSQSSMPIRLVQTTSAAVAATAQTGSSLYTKGWPTSTSGLLLAGDWFEINGELKQLTSPVNSDAAGLAYMQFRPSLAGAPADNDPIVVFEPFGRFIYPAGTREFENLFGIYGDCEMNLEEIYV